MPKITFDQLIPIYRDTAFNQQRTGGKVGVSTHSVLDTLKLIDDDDNAFRDSGVRILDDPEALAIGSLIDLEIAPPRLGLGVLARNLDELLSSPMFRLEQPIRYYLIEERFAYNDDQLPESVIKYRSAVKFVKALSEAAAFVDKHRAEATFMGPGRLRLPINYSAPDLNCIASSIVEELENFVHEKIHRDQKLAILSSSVIELCTTLPESERFAFLLKNLKQLVSNAQDGYKMFASEFSYEKIRGKTEEAIGEYTNKIHKTFHDIQNQVMGVPLATVIVATQFKSAPQCTIEFWANLSISIGATLFVMLLSVAIYNQLMTLRNIEDDLVRQEDKLEKDYSTVAASFLPMYAKLKKRVRTHRWVMRAILVSSWAGLALTWYIYTRLTGPELISCVG